MTRIMKKSTNEPLRFVKAYTEDKEKFDKIISLGKIKVGYTIVKSKPWFFVSNCQNGF